MPTSYVIAPDVALLESFDRCLLKGHLPNSSGSSSIRTQMFSFGISSNSPRPSRGCLGHKTSMLLIVAITSEPLGRVLLKLEAPLTCFREENVITACI